jgi:hypothetical protein
MMDIRFSLQYLWSVLFWIKQNSSQSIFMFSLCITVMCTGENTLWLSRHVWARKNVTGWCWPGVPILIIRTQMEILYSTCWSYMKNWWVVKHLVESPSFKYSVLSDVKLPHPEGLYKNKLAFVSKCIYLIWHSSEDSFGHGDCCHSLSFASQDTVLLPKNNYILMLLTQSSPSL